MPAQFVPEVQGIPVVMQLGLNALTQAPVICWCGGQPLFQTEAGNLFNGNIAENSPLYTYADSLNWSRGVHNFKGGVEARFASSRLRDDVDSNSWSTFARAFGGETQYTPIQGITSTNMPGLQGTATTGNVSGDAQPVDAPLGLAFRDSSDVLVRLVAGARQVRRLPNRRAARTAAQPTRILRHSSRTTGS